MTRAAQLLSTYSSLPEGLKDFDPSEFDTKVASKELNTLVKKWIGVDANISVEVKSNRAGNTKVTVTSDDLSKKMKPRMFKDLRISEFGGSVGDGSIWVPVHYDYKHIDGGSNGTAIGTVWFNYDGSIQGSDSNF